jgi:hypothetical protein
MARFYLRLLCRIYGHKRSRRRAYLDPVERRWRSYCARCGIPMRKDAVDGWLEE